MLKQLVDSYFWFGVPTVNLIPADKAFGYFFAILAIMGVIALLVLKLKDKQTCDVIIRKLRSLWLYTGFFGLFWFWLRYENVSIFGDRYWAGIIILVVLVWAGKIIKFGLVDYKQICALEEKEATKKKYLSNK
jgi:hypothetical protein